VANAMGQPPPYDFFGLGQLGPPHQHNNSAMNVDMGMDLNLVPTEAVEAEMALQAQLLQNLPDLNEEPLNIQEQDLGLDFDALFDLNVEMQKDGLVSMEIVHPGQSIDSVEEVQQNPEEVEQVVLALAASLVNFLPLEIQPEDLTSDVDSGSGAALSAQNGVENLDQENESRGSLPVPLTAQTHHAEQSGVDLDEHLLQLVIPMQGATMQI
jgi:hypothetical protein